MSGSRTVAVIEGTSFALAIGAVIIFATALVTGSISPDALSLGIGLVVAALLLVTLPLALRHRSAKTIR